MWSIYGEMEAWLNEATNRIPFVINGLNVCPALPGAFQAALHGVLTLSRLDEAVRDTMRRGGCTASRASFIGACLGAQVS